MKIINQEHGPWEAVREVMPFCSGERNDDYCWYIKNKTSYLSMHDKNTKTYIALMFSNAVDASKIAALLNMAD